MNHRPTAFEVETGSLPANICCDDPEPDMPFKFLIRQDEDMLCVTLDGLNNLVDAAKALLEARGKA